MCFKSEHIFQLSFVLSRSLDKLSDVYKKIVSDRFWIGLAVLQGLILGLALLAIAMVEQPLTVSIANTAGKTDPRL